MGVFVEILALIIVFAPVVVSVIIVIINKINGVYNKNNRENRCNGKLDCEIANKIKDKYIINNSSTRSSIINIFENFNISPNFNLPNSIIFIIYSCDVVQIGNYRKIVNGTDFCYWVFNFDNNYYIHDGIITKEEFDNYLK